MDTNKLKQLATTIRVLSAEGVEKANSGHPGMPMGAADYAAVLWSEYLRFNPRDTGWLNRDIFVLSAGHGSMLLYSLLHLFGYELPMSELQSFRQWGSKTPGHPEFGLTPGVETTTGPLGAGFSNGVGIAMTGKLLQARYSEELFSHRVFGIVSDGDLQEGVASEAGSLAGHLGLDNLVYFYDDNEISIGGNTNVSFTENVNKRFEAYGWHVEDIDGHNMQQVASAIDSALAVKGKPKLIVCHSTIGWGSPNKASTAKVHGEPLGKEELKLVKEKLGWNYDKEFHVPDEVRAFCAERVEAKKRDYDEWQTKFKSWCDSNPDKAKLLKMQQSKELPKALKDDLIAAFKDGKKEATRNLSDAAIQVCAKHLPGFLGGSADLEPSTKTLIKGSPDIQKESFAGKNIRFGVREHGMGGILNGLAYSKLWFPYSATFLVFSDYMRPTIRLAAISELQSLFIFTHDSFYVGEDGPTHEPIEHVQTLRAIPHLHVYRPADGMEVGMCYLAALQRTKGPSILLFTRQGLPPIDRGPNGNTDDILKGGYIVSGHDVTDLVIMATGSEVWVASGAAKMLAEKGIKARVVSLPCVELFQAQDKSYRDKVLPPNSQRVSVEAGITCGWERLVGANGLTIGIDHYGASAPAEVLAEKFGFTPQAVTAKITEWLNKK